jgi:6-phosphogluconate dehydrogenase (decarboxylating)
MQIGMIGLGRMGADMVRRLINGGHQCVVFNGSPQKVEDLVKEKAVGMMIGGEKEVVKHLDPIFATLSPGIGDIPRTTGCDMLGGTSEQGYLDCGPNGAGATSSRWSTMASSMA